MPKFKKNSFLIKLFKTTFFGAKWCARDEILEKRVKIIMIGVWY